MKNKQTFKHNALSFFNTMQLAFNLFVSIVINEKQDRSF
jgi:hypothetical protein